MKALTLHQPWASLIAVGAKRVETRSWSTAYRGPLAIHAAKRPLGTGALNVGEWTNVTGEPIAGDEQTMLRGGPLDPERLVCPLGAVVASATLVDVVPITEYHPKEPTERWCQEYDWHRLDAKKGRRPADRRRDLWLLGPTGSPDDRAECITSELPFGDFTPGRFAWLLGDVARVEDRCPWCWGHACGDPICPCQDGDLCHYRSTATTDAWPNPPAPCPVCSGAGKVDPVPARGRQGLWEWSAPDEEKRKG